MTGTQLSTPVVWHDIFSLLTEDPEKARMAAALAEQITRETEEHINKVPMWSSFTATAAQTTELTTSTNICIYMQLGKLVVAVYRLTFSSSGTTNGTLTLSLPVEAASTRSIGGSGYLADPSASDSLIGVASGETSSTVSFFQHDTAASGSKLGNNHQIVSGDIFIGSVIYRAV